jgi:pyruvate kinase
MTPQQDIQQLWHVIESLLTDVRKEAEATLADWRPRISDPAFHPSAENLAAYVALRHRDLRPLQRELMAIGLSSLGRIESRVVPTLQAVRASLAAMCGESGVERPSTDAFFAGERLIDERSAVIFGPGSERRPVALLCTCPSEAASDPAFMRALAEHRVEAIRINCAHDDPDAWARMIEHARAAERQTGWRMRVFMDLGGPKIRSGAVRTPEGRRRIRRDERFAIVPGGMLDQPQASEFKFAAECTLSEIVQAARPGEHLYFDDGKLGAVVERAEPWGLVARAMTCTSDGVKLQPEKGLNFPDTKLDLAALTSEDLSDLDFVAANADGVGFSFVQSADDVAMLQDALASRNNDWQRLALIMKIETPRGVSNLPEIIMQSAGRQPTAIMIARGDLAVEIGFARLAEMQEEILWIAEAAQVPVIWATQVLEHLVKKGRPLRGEMTDAAMAARAECVMLNKGPHLVDAIEVLDTLLGRMDAHLHKKTPQLRALKSW